tara:strand:+ start:925 stop:1101 length:177 start_codon:yes stop_codon:yes gene_type:complete
MPVMLVDQVLQPLIKVAVVVVLVVLQQVNQCLQLVLLELVDWDFKYHLHLEIQRRQLL